MKSIELDKLVEALIGEIKNKEDFDKVKEQLLKLGLESLLKVEIKARLGYEKGNTLMANNQRNDFSKKTMKSHNS